MKKALFFMILMFSTLLLSANDKKVERASNNVFFEYVNGEIVEWHVAALEIISETEFKIVDLVDNDYILFNEVDGKDVVIENTNGEYDYYYECHCDDCGNIWEETKRPPSSLCAICPQCEAKAEWGLNYPRCHHGLCVLFVRE